MLKNLLVDIEFVFYDILSFFTLLWLEEKHPVLRNVLLNYVIPGVLSVISTVATIILIST